MPKIDKVNDKGNHHPHALWLAKYFLLNVDAMNELLILKAAKERKPSSWHHEGQHT